MAKSKFFKILGKNILPILAGIILLCILCNISYNNALVEGFKEGIPHALHHKYAAGAHMDEWKKNAAEKENRENWQKKNKGGRHVLAERKKWQAELQGLKASNKKGGGCNKKKCGACRRNFIKAYNSLRGKWGQEAKKAGCGPKGFPCINSCAKCGRWRNPCQKRHGRRRKAKEGFF